MVRQYLLVYWEPTLVEIISDASRLLLYTHGPGEVCLSTSAECKNKSEDSYHYDGQQCCCNFHGRECCCIPESKAH